MNYLSIYIFFIGLMPFLLSANEQGKSISAGKTIVAIGVVQAKDLAEIRALKRRSSIFQTDVVSTGNESNTQLRMVDGALLSLQEHTQLTVVEYQFNKVTNKGSVGLSLVEGGLRTITGLLNGGEGNYNLQTPVASIGVRGTHYEAELIDGDLFLSVWDGIIDVNVTVGSVDNKFSIGNNQDYSFAIVRSDGSVEFTLHLPDTFAHGHNHPIGQQLTFRSGIFKGIEEKFNREKAIKLASVENEFNSVLDKSYPLEFDESGKSWIDNDALWAGLAPDTPSIISDKTGLVVFDHFLEQSLSSSSGAISNLLMNMTVNFDTGRIPTGQISFSDNSGQWFAAFNGVISQAALEMNINFASHGNNLADGNISGLFLNNGSQILGEISLSELINSTNTVGGSFLLVETP